MNLLKAILITRTTGFGFTYISKMINGILSKESKKSYPACAKCIGVLCDTASEKKRSSVVTSYINQLESSSSNEQQKVVALLCIGEIGRRINFFNHDDDIHIKVSKSFEDQSEEVKSAAAFALGNLALGNLSKVVPYILEELSEKEERRYLLLQSLREIIVRFSKSDKQAKDFYEILNCRESIFLYCKSSKEGVRNVVAECVGRLASVNIDDMLPKIIEKLSSENPDERSTACGSLKFIISDSSLNTNNNNNNTNNNNNNNDELLKPKIPLFLDLLSDIDVNVRRSALIVFNFLVHNKPILILNLLEKYLPMVYNETIENSDLLRKVKVGPFTHVVDDGLENRKAAFECMYTLLETCSNQINISDFIENLVRGLEDNSSDIKSMCHIMLEHLAQSNGTALVLVLDSVVEPLRTTLEKKPKESAVKQDKERYEELVRSALRAILVISQIPGSESCSKFNDFLNVTVKSGEIGEKFANLKDSPNQDSTTIMMDISA